MKNDEIIYNAAIASGLFSKAEAASILATGASLPLHTYQEWRRMGYQVRQGQKAALVVELWRYKDAKTTEEADGTEKTEGGHHYKQRAHLFHLAQVEKKAPARVKTREEIMAYNRMLAEQRKARAAS